MPENLLDRDRLDLDALVQSVVLRASRLLYDRRQGGQPVGEIAWKWKRGRIWQILWIDPNTRQQRQESAHTSSEQIADDVLKRKQAELLLGLQDKKSNRPWAEFRQQYETTVLPGKALATATVTIAALDAFERLVGPAKMRDVTTEAIDKFTALRRQEPSQRRPGEKVSPATVNKELRHLRAVLKKARKWKYLELAPEFEFEREPKRLPTYIPPEDFAKLYQACDQATLPRGFLWPAGDWWRALLVTAYLTGWRIGAIMSLQRKDLDLVTGKAKTMAEDNKGSRDQVVPLHPIVLEHLRRLPGFSLEIFPWPYHRRTLDNEFHRLCDAAGVPRYGFHAAKKAFCTLNAPLIDEATLGYLAQHQSPLTTKKFYINPTAKVEEAVAKLFVPDVLKRMPS